MSTNISSKLFIFWASLINPTKVVTPHRINLCFDGKEGKPPHRHAQVTQNDFSPVDFSPFTPWNYFDDEIIYLLVK